MEQEPDTFQTFPRVEEEPNEFRSLRRKLGVKQLWQRYEEDGVEKFKFIFLNGQHPLRYPSPKCDHHLEVRAEDGKTVLAQIDARTLFEHDGLQSYIDNMDNWPIEFANDAVLANRMTRLQFPYPTFTGDEQNLVRAPQDPFFTTLGIPHFLLNDGEYRDFNEIVPFHLELILQWRDLQRLRQKEFRVDTLRRRINKRAGIERPY